MRGLIRPLTALEARDRAFSQIAAVPTPPPGSPVDGGNRPIAYRLEGGYNGGADPFAPHCASWSFGNRTPTADCIGLALWASGIDRKQPTYSGTRGEWLNCASLMDDAVGAARFCKLVHEADARVGDWLLTRDHIGIVVRPASPLAKVDLLVVDCSPRHGRNAAVNTGLPWSDTCVVVRPTFYLAAA